MSVLYLLLSFDLEVHLPLLLQLPRLVREWLVLEYAGDEVLVLLEFWDILICLQEGD